MIMSYKDTENPNFNSYFYFLNGHNDVIYFADANFIEEKIESYEYNPWGVLLTSANKNNLLFASNYFDFETRNLLLFGNIYKPELGFFTKNVKNFIKLKALYRKRNFEWRNRDGLIPGKFPDKEDECYNNCMDECLSDIDDCNIKCEAWVDMCIDGYLDKIHNCSDRDEMFSFIDFQCYSDAWDYVEECLRHTEDKLAKCYDDAWAEYLDCVDSCLY